MSNVWEVQHKGVAILPGGRKVNKSPHNRFDGSRALGAIGSRSKKWRKVCWEIESAASDDLAFDGTLPDVLEFLPLLEERRKGKPRDGPGCVYLVGTGPGDPGLLTLRAVHLMQTADVVLYDRLVSDDILKMVHNDARMIYVGKQRSFHTRTQTEIHQLMMQFAEAGATVLRLKGGDPYIFGRGGEELLYLKERGIPIQCVPGITAASGISAELGIPLTHRGVATTVRFLTGHSREGGEEDLDDTIDKSVDPLATLVVYMGLNTLPALASKLIKGGESPRTPAVAVERGTTPEQRMVYASIEDLPKATVDANLKSPTLILIGDVVGLSPGWERFQESGQNLQEGMQDAYLPKGIDFALPNFNDLQQEGAAR